MRKDRLTLERVSAQDAREMHVEDGGRGRGEAFDHRDADDGEGEGGGGGGVFLPGRTEETEFCERGLASENKRGRRRTFVVKAANDHAHSLLLRAREVHPDVAADGAASTSYGHAVHPDLLPRAGAQEEVAERRLGPCDGWRRREEGVRRRGGDQVPEIEVGCGGEDERGVRRVGVEGCAEERVVG